MIYRSSSVGAANLDASSQEVNNTNVERDFQNPLYSETGPLYYQHTESKSKTEGEYKGPYSDYTMNGEALYESTQNSVIVVQRALSSTKGNAVHVTASGACMYGNNMHAAITGQY